MIPENLNFLRSFDSNRLFLQTSVDGIGKTNDKFRGKNTFKYIIKGNDINHSYYAKNNFTSNDPYLPLYNSLALWLMTKSAKITPNNNSNKNNIFPQIRRKIGGKILPKFSEF